MNWEMLSIYLLQSQTKGLGKSKANIISLVPHTKKYIICTFIYVYSSTIFNWLHNIYIKKKAQYMLAADLHATGHFYRFEFV